jgi:hypothetical protein
MKKMEKTTPGKKVAVRMMFLRQSAPCGERGWERGRALTTNNNLPSGAERESGGRRVVKTFGYNRVRSEGHSG